jgi:hypothetical protein
MGDKKAGDSARPVLSGRRCIPRESRGRTVVYPIIARPRSTKRDLVPVLSFAAGGRSLRILHITNALLRIVVNKRFTFHPQNRAMGGQTHRRSVEREEF